MKLRPCMALAAVALLLTGTAAQAQRRDGGGRGWRERSYEARGGGYDRGGYDGERGRGRRFQGGQEGGGYEGERGWRRGQVLPPAYRGAYVPDPGRYRLRAAPNGYGWVGDGRNAYLTQRSTGMVLEAVPGAYDPGPEPRRGRGPRRPARSPLGSTC